MDQPRIWSWTLMYKFGKYMFKSVTGEEGYEYIFSPEQFYQVIYSNFFSQLGTIV